jgi:1-acyl-sn-glycerol-3-phosphate acyltransferase
MQTLDFDEYTPGIDYDFIKKFINKTSFILKLLRFNIFNDELVDEKRSTVYCTNHGQGFWGIVDVFLAVHYWYGIKGFKTPLYLISEDIVFKIPLIGFFAKRLGLKVAGREVVEKLLDTNASIVIPPGGDGELLKPVWMKNKPVFTKSIYLNGKMKLKTQEWFVDVIMRKSKPVVSLGISGTHEMTPILYTSFWIHKYSGQAYLRRDELLPGYPITINHFINFYLFSLLSISENIYSWIIFILAHIYIDFLYTYPIIFRKLYVNFNAYVPSPINSSQYMSLPVRERKKYRCDFLKILNKKMTNALYEIDRNRNDFFSFVYEKIYKKYNTLQKIYSSTIRMLFRLYMKRYVNYKGYNEEIYFLDCKEK